MSSVSMSSVFSVHCSFFSVYYYLPERRASGLHCSFFNVYSYLPERRASGQDCALFEEEARVDLGAIESDRKLVDSLALWILGQHGIFVDAHCIRGEEAPGGPRLGGLSEEDGSVSVQSI